MMAFAKRVTLDSLPTLKPLLKTAATGDQDDDSGDDVNQTRQSAPPDPDLQNAEAQFSGQRQRVNFGFAKPVRRRPQSQPGTPPATPPVPPVAPPAVPVAPAPVAPAPPAPAYQLQWQGTPLTRRDLGIPDGARTNAAGSISLDKGLGTPSSFQHYFRDDVFAALNWTPSGPTVDEAYAKIALEVQGTNYGEFDVRIAHTTSTTTKSYTQGNAMSRLSWGPMKPHVAKAALIGKTMSLYRDTTDPTRFKIEIA